MDVINKCKKCGSEVKVEKDDCEPLLIYRCPKCNEVEFKSLNNYEG